MTCLGQALRSCGVYPWGRGRLDGTGQPLKRHHLYSGSCGLKAQQGVSKEPMTVLMRQHPLQTPARPEEYEAILIQFQSERRGPILSFLLAFLLTLYPNPTSNLNFDTDGGRDQFSKPGKEENSRKKCYHRINIEV